MNILVLNGSPRLNGHTSKMVAAFKEGANSHNVNIINVAKKNIRGCQACEYCHNKGKGTCIIKDDMQEIYPLLKEAEMLVLASPIYYHNLSGQLKCTIDRFYAIGFKKDLPQLKKVAMFLSSGDQNIYDGALYSLNGDFKSFLDLKVEGVFTYSEKDESFEDKLNMIKSFGENL